MNGTLLKSKDGITWNKFSIPSSQKLHPDAKYNFNDVMWDGSKFIAVGSTIISSTDGESWTIRSLNNDCNLNSIIYNNGYYVSVGYFGEILISTDGFNWHYASDYTQNTSLNFHHILSYGKNFMLLSSNGCVFNFSINKINNIKKDGIDSSWENSTDIKRVHLYGIAANSSNRLVSVGVCGTIKTSSDGLSWKIVNSGTKNRLNNVKVFNNKFFVVGNGGTILYSEDGLKWTTINTSTNSDLNDIAYSGSGFVAVGTNGVTLYSIDGKKWNVNTSGSSNINLKSVVYFKNQFYTAGDEGWDGVIFASKDGKNWYKDTESYGNTFQNIVCNNNTIVVSGNWATGLASNDGVNWNNINTTCEVNGKMLWTGKYFIIAENSQLSYSMDGYKWSSSNLNTFSYFDCLDTITRYNNKIIGIFHGYFASSNDGINWSEIPSMVPAQTFTDVVWGDGKFIAVGNKGTIVKSKNGKTWSAINSNFDAGILSIEWNGDRYVAGAVSGNILTSKYGDKWTAIQLPNLKEPGSTWIEKIKWVNDRFIAITNFGEVYSSKNGLQWSKIYDSKQESYVQSIANYNNKIIIAELINTNTIVLTSQDGIKWSQNLSNEKIISTVGGSNCFVSATEDGRLLKSTDGIHWNKVFQTNFDFGDTGKLYWNGEQFIFLNGSYDTTSGQCEISSKDGVNWDIKYIDNAVIMDCNGLNWNGSEYVSVGGQTTLTTASKQVYSDSRPAYINIKGNNYFNITGKNYTYNFNTDLFDQFGKTMLNKNIEWTINTSLSGVSINSKTGQLFIPAKCSKGTAVVNAKVSGTVHTLASKTIYIGQQPLVKLNNSSLTLKQGDASKLAASLSTGNSSSDKFSWESSDISIVTVDDNGKINTIGCGKATITVVNEADGSEASCDVTVNPVVKVTSVSLNKTTDILTVGSTDTLSATVAPSNVTNKAVTWASSNTKVATVVNGVIKAVSKGTAKITVATVDGEKAASCTVTVNPVVKVTSVSLNKTTDTLTVGSTDTLSATPAPGNATNKTVTWTTSNSKVATVVNGVVKAVSAGTVKITATTVDGSKTASCTVMVNNPVVKVTSVKLNKTTDTLKVGNTDRLIATAAPGNATNKSVIWASSNTKVATVVNGVVKAVSKGTAKITVTTVDGKKAASCVVTVN